jgi:hypothetical protein
MVQLLRRFGDDKILESVSKTRLKPIGSVVRWGLVITPMAVSVGSLCALFLWALDQATRLRFLHPWLLFGLPFAGAAIGFLYHWKGRAA